MTVQDQIDSYIKNQLQKILLGQSIPLYKGGIWTFRTNAGRLVLKQQENTENPDDYPLLVFFTDKNTTIIDDTVEVGMENHLQEVSIEGIIASDKGGTQGDDLRQDISAAIKADPWWDGLILEMQNFETAATVEIGDVVFSIVKVSFIVKYSALYGSE